MSTLLRLATAGSVDDGKSTLVGRLLFDSKSVLADQLESVERVSRDRGLSGADLALLTDGLRAEREQGITIDVAYRYFATAKRTFILADCPGHVQYTRNTVTGASTADVVVLLIDARKGLLEQTRRHLAVASLLRVPNVVVAINKIDLLGYSHARYEELHDDIAVAARALGIESVTSIPVSALEGANVVQRSAHTPWWEGPTLLSYLESVPADGFAVSGSAAGGSAAGGTALPTSEQPFRFPVQSVIRPQLAGGAEYRDYRGYAGRVASGTVRIGDPVTVLPSGTTTTVSGIDLLGARVSQIFAGQSATLRLTDELDVTRGDSIVSGELPVLTQDVQGTVAWLAEQPLRPGARLLLKHTTRTTTAIVRDIGGTLNLDSARLEPAEHLALNDIGSVTLRLASPIAADEYARNRSTGSFLLIDQASGATLAAGMVGNALTGAVHPETRPLNYAI
ncbi:sulfate adenylyltransferase subunit 1 [Timonella senegalensis]|uniref:sulfate adenylyltransferase subunit 1 n=1 Tax=Timonella senegalensis TaxID=1465825 RepID=UPI0028A7A9DE|nr:GTP-binding protein [Timonella senegalensis]